MKLFFTLFLALNMLAAAAQCSGYKAPMMTKNALPEAWKPIEGDYLWMNNTEMSNVGYMEFLYHVRKHQGEEAYQKMLPDTLVWRKPTAYGEPFVEYYFRHPAYRNYPVVGVTYEQAQSYCRFATEAINTWLKNNPKGPIEEVLVRLPTRKEWESAAQAGNQYAIYPWGDESLRQPSNHKFAGQSRANHLREKRFAMISGDGSIAETGDLTAPVQSYWPNPWGLYNMSGNVSELVAEKGECKGGSWGSMGYDLRIQQSAKVDSASCFVGFRPMLEVVKFRNGDFKVPQLSAKFIEESLAKIPRGSYSTGGSDDLVIPIDYKRTRIVSTNGFQMWKTEIPNWLYQLFLTEMVAKDASLANQYRVRDEYWLTETSLAIMNNYSTQNRFANYPVVNINYRSANAFCEWLTDKYNSLPGRKYQDVVFRLPHEIEWEIAARGGLTNNPYPWGGPYDQNAHGCYLANFNPVPETHLSLEKKRFVKNYPNGDSTLTRGLDGGVLTVPVDSYYPNGYGLFNMAGNVAEMLLGKYAPEVYQFAHDLNPNYESTVHTDSITLVRGGSFASMDYALPVYARDFDEVERMHSIGLDALPTIGFRVVMVRKDN